MLARLLLATVILFSLAACSSGPHVLRLVETKAAVQLLRNEAWFRLPDLMVKEDRETSDVSIACAGDDSGLRRYWKSSTIALLNNSFAPRVLTLADDLAGTFEEQGWDAVETASDSSILVTLTKPISFAVIEIEAKTKAVGQRASIRITTTGPCVATEGAGSDEVRALEESARGQVTAG